jgi:hypothetical protein
MIHTFLIWFGLSGLMTVALCLAAIILCVARLRHPRRERFFAVALALACAGWLCADWHNSRVGAIQLDKSDEERAVLQENQRKMDLEEQARRMSGEFIVRFAEDAKGEASGQTILTLKELSAKQDESPPVGFSGDTTTNVVHATNDAAGAASADYRSGGKQKRETGKVDTRAETKANKAVASTEKEQGSGPLLKLREYQLSKLLNRLNSLLANLVLYAVLGLLVGDYLRRFNRPLDPYFPLPVSAPWLEHLSPSRLLVHWPDAKTGAANGFLEWVVRRGQSFVYFGDRVAGDLAWIERLRFRRWAVWRLPVLRWGSEGMPTDPEFLLDAVWFNRYAATVPPALAVETLLGMMQRLDERAICRARARWMPHVILDLATLPEPDLLRRLAALCVETGLRLVIVGGRLPADLEADFDAISTVSLETEVLQVMKGAGNE